MATKAEASTPGQATPHQPAPAHPLGAFSVLPIEIRLIIWTFVTSRIGLRNELEWPDPRSTHGAGIRDRRHALALLRLNKQIYSEAVPIVYGGKTFRIWIAAPQARRYLHVANGWKHFIAADEDAAPEHMPGPAGPSPTSWWHLLAGIEVCICRGVRMHINVAWDCRVWEILAQKRKVVRLVNGLKNAQDQGLGLRSLEIHVTGNGWDFQTLGGDGLISHFCRSQSGLDWLDTVDGHRLLQMPNEQEEETVCPVRNLPDRPWKDLEFVLMDFKSLRNVGETDVEFPSCNRDPDDPLYNNGCFCFDDPEPLAETMKRPAGSDYPGIHDKAMISKMEEFHATTVRYWETHDYQARRKQ